MDQHNQKKATGSSHSDFDYLVFNDGNLQVGILRHPEDAAALVAVLGDGAQIRGRDGCLLWWEGHERSSAGASYDVAAKLMRQRLVRTILDVVISLPAAPVPAQAARSAEGADVGRELEELARFPGLRRVSDSHTPKAFWQYGHRYETDVIDDEGRRCGLVVLIRKDEDGFAVYAHPQRDGRNFGAFPRRAVSEPTLRAARIESVLKACSSYQRYAERYVGRRAIGSARG